MVACHLNLLEDRGARRFCPAVLTGIVLCVLTYLCLDASVAQAITPTARPNIVFILADDLGYGDLGCQNPASRLQTPRLDRLASQGMRFTDAHAPSALCTPSRYSILTGQHCWRSRLKWGVLNMWDEPLIGGDQLTVAGMLRNKGYRTACFGKWHLGLAWPFVGAAPLGFDTKVNASDIDWSRRIAGGPVDCGFDYYFGINVPNEAPFVFIENDRTVGVPTVEYPTVPGQQGHFGGPGVAGWDWSQALPQITSNTVRWIRNAASSGNAQPFFVYAPLVGPHQPVVPSARFQGTSQAGVYGDYVQELDWAVGQMLDALDATGASTNTLVIFTSDNGPDEFAYERLRQYQHASMGPLRGIKSDIWEGGHRVPFLARWPGNITSGSTNSQTICLIDFMRTVADVVGAQLPADAAQDSVSLLPTLLGAKPAAPVTRLLVLESGVGQFGIRSNNWMFIDSSTGDGHNPEAEPIWFEQSRKYIPQNQSPALLYDLSRDLGEGQNLASVRPEVARALQARLRVQRASVGWRGAASGDWAVNRNWAELQGPTGADVVYSNLTGVANFTQTLSTGFNVNSIIIDSSLGSNLRLTATNGGHLTLANGIDMWAANANLSIEAPVEFSQSQLWNVSQNHQLQVKAPLVIGSHSLMLCGSGEMIFASPISGEGRLTIRSSGNTILESSNSFTGGTELSGGGFLVARNNEALGTGTLTIPNNSTLVVAPGVSLPNEAIVRGYGAEYGGHRFGAITVGNNGTGVYQGALHLTGDVGLRANVPEGVLALRGSMTGNGNVTILPGAGTVSLGTNQLYTGNTIILGRLKLESGADLLPTTTDIIFDDWHPAQLELDNNDQTVASIRGGGPRGGEIVLGGGTLTIKAAANSVYAGSISGAGNIRKFGSGKVVVDGLNGYQGRTEIREGELVVNGALGRTEVAVEGGTLSGSGSIGGSVYIADGALLAQAHTPGPLSIDHDIVIGPGGTVQVEVDPLQGTAGSIQSFGSITYGGRLVVRNLVPGWAITNGQTFRLFSSIYAKGNFSRIEPNPGPGLVWQFTPERGLLTAVTQPRLHFTVTPASAVISWSDPRFHLQASTNFSALNTGTTWFDYPGGSTSPIDLPVNGTSNMFFRLVSP